MPVEPVHEHAVDAASTLDVKRALTARRLLVCASVLFVALRVGLFFVAHNYQADALNRVALAVRWAAHPRHITDAGAVWVFGPLQIELAGIGVLLAGADIGARLPNLLAGCLLIVPLVRLSRRTGAPFAPALAVAAVAVCALHLQASTSAESEALFATPLLLALDATLYFCATGRLRDALLGAFMLMLAEAIRYEGWMYGGLLCALVLVTAVRQRFSSLKPLPVAIYLIVAALFPLAWMEQNAVHLGSPFYTFIEHARFHREFAAQRFSSWGPSLFRLHAIAFWPLSLMLILSPGVAVLGVVGAVRALKMQWAKSLLAIVALPPLVLALRAFVLCDFGLLVRFVVAVSCVLACFVGLGVQVITDRKRGRIVDVAWLMVVSLAIALPCGIALRSHDHGDRFAEKLRPFSPIADLPPAVAEAARYLDHRARIGPPMFPLLVDNNGGFGAMALAFYGHLDERDLVQVGAPRWQERHAATKVRCAILFDDGVIGSQPDDPTRHTVERWGAPPGGERLRFVCP